MRECLAEACHNTFVILDCVDQVSLNDQILRHAHMRLKEEGRDDALILIDGRSEGESFSARMVVLGLDGELGEYCGNGARACAAYLFNKSGSSYRSLFLRTGTWLHRLSQLGKDQFSVTLPPVSFVLNPKFIALYSKIEPFQYVEAIEPHIVIEKEMSNDELTAIGRALNQQKDVFPLGINVNAWHFLKNRDIAVKTYERGVQRLTQSCGTGSISCASVVARGQKNPTTVNVVTPGGPLRIVIRKDEIELCGEGKI